MSKPSSDTPRTPGGTLLKIARWLLDERVISTAVRPTISDLQREVARAEPGRLRFRARWRGYAAFWRVLCVCVTLPADARGIVAFPDALARIAVASIVVSLIAVGGPAHAGWVGGIAAAAALLAIVMHGWYTRHPSDLPAPPEPTRPPQINFSSTDVAGNIGGLIFAVGSVLIIAIGVPSVIWFLLAGVAAGSAVAWGLTVWRVNHPHHSVPDESPIGLR